MSLSKVSLAASLVVTLAAGIGCGSTTIAPDTTPVDRGVEPGPKQQPGAPPVAKGTEVNPYGKPYPTTNLGYFARAGGRPGNIIRNYKFLGYRDGNPSKGTTVISLADLYDPEMKTNTLIHFSAGALWCPPCNDEAAATVPLVPDLKARKIIIIQAIIEGSARGTGSTLADLDTWQARHKVNYTLFTDPEQQNLGQFFDAAAIPWNAMIDARSMELLQAGTGFGGIEANQADYTKWTKWIAENPAQAPK